MAIFSKDKVEERGSFGEVLQYVNYTSYNANRAMLLSTVYRCVEVISDSVAQLPLHLYNVGSDGYKKENVNHPVSYLLTNEPNKKMTRFTFIKLLVSSMLLKGAAFAYIDRDNRGNVTRISYIPTENVTITETPTDLIYNIVGIGQVESDSMIHLLNFSYDGVHGISTLKHANKTLQIAWDEEDAAGGFFRSGGNLSGLITSDAPLTAKQKQDIKNSFLGSQNGSNGNPNGIALLDASLKYQSIQVNPADAELLESRKYTTTDICRFFGLSPMKAFDYANSSYNSVEAAQLAFLTDTLAPMLAKIEAEFKRKLLKPSEKQNTIISFDTSVLLRTDKTSLTQWYRELFNLGVLSPNEIRKELDLAPIEGGDNHFMQVNISTIDKITTMDLEDNPNASNQLKEVNDDTENTKGQ